MIPDSFHIIKRNVKDARLNIRMVYILQVLGNGTVIKFNSNFDTKNPYAHPYDFKINPVLFRTGPAPTFVMSIIDKFIE